MLVWNISFVWKLILVGLDTCLEVWNFICVSLEHLFGYCKETIVRMLVWNCLETLVLEILV